MKTHLSLLLLALCLSPCFCNAQTQSARAIMQRVKDRPNGDTREGEIDMTLINKRGNSRIRKLYSYSIDVGPNRQNRKTMMFFQFPSDVAGTAFLTWDYDNPNQEDDRWLYLPSMKKTRRISGASAKKDYFMGSDFTYDDMGNRSVDEDTHTLLEDVVYDNHKCWKIKSVPKDKREVYGHKISLIRQDCLMPVYVQYFDKQGRLQRELRTTDIRKIDGFWAAQRMEMKNVQTGHQTIIEMKHLRFNRPMTEAAFVVTNLEKGSL